MFFIFRVKAFDSNKYYSNTFGTWWFLRKFQNNTSEIYAIFLDFPIMHISDDSDFISKSF